MAHRLSAIAVSFLFASAVLADANVEKEMAEEFKSLKSDWTVAKATLAGNDAYEHLKVLEFTIHDEGRYTAKLGDEKDEGTFTVDLSATPKSMVIKPTGGPGKDKVLKAIYKLDGSTLTICYDRDGKVTPTKFESTAANKFLLIEYKRKK